MTTDTLLLSETDSPEIFIGIVSPVGTSINSTIAALTQEFEAKNYAVHHIRISTLFPEIAKSLNYDKLDETTRYKRIDSYIAFANKLRDKKGSGFLATYALSQIIEKRSQGSNRRNVYIINQLKTEIEIKNLREIYGASFFQISIYSARHVRVDTLAREMAHDNHRRDTNFFRGKAESLVSRDEDEIDEDNGQQVGKIFQLADFVVNADRPDDRNSVATQVKRFIELLFGHNGYSPTRRVYGMFLAHSAALRSLDLSRQVGAAIFRRTGEIAALGANEVPRAGGGTYWDEDIFDAREYKIGSDSNDQRKKEIMDEILSILDVNFESLNESKKEEIDDSQFMDALEYGRIVHAEMSAITDAARLGIDVHGAKLYCTTFPCHMCSKLIVASGISEVIFLEPYPKSLTADLHSDSVHIEGMSRGTYEHFPSVMFSPFFGITPRRYREFFSRTKRKVKGKFQTYRHGKATPMFESNAASYLKLESTAIASLPSTLASPFED